MATSGSLCSTFWSTGAQSGVQKLNSRKDMHVGGTIFPPVLNPLVGIFYLCFNLEANNFIKSAMTQEFQICMCLDLRLDTGKEVKKLDKQTKVILGGNFH